MNVRYTNFEGDWDSDCRYCGKPQRSHQVELGELEGTMLIHRQPCGEEQQEITERAVYRAIGFRCFLTAYDFGVYLWGRIPFKAEFALAFSTLKRSFISIRALFYLWRDKSKNKKKK